MRDDSAAEKIEELKNRAIERAPDFEPWGYYYRLRAAEMKVLFSLHDIGKPGRILEIGCGNGFASAVFSGLAAEIVATDLSSPDRFTHSIGISRTKEFFKRMDIGNCAVVSCSGERLPFRGGIFDLVFCAHTLEHIQDRAGVLREARRVLRDDGEALFMMPTFMSRLFYPLSYYPRLMARAAAFSFNRHPAKRGGAAGGGKDRGASSAWRNIKKNYPHFPAPEPHGAFKNFFEEAGYYRPRNWLRLFKEGGFTVTRVFSTGLAPRDLMTLFINPLAFLKLYEKNLWISKKLGAKPLLRTLGQDLCVVLKKGRP